MYMVHMTFKVDRWYKSIFVSRVVVVVMDQSLSNCIQAVQLMENINLHEVLLISIFIVPETPVFWSKNANVWVLLDFEDVVARNWKHGDIGDAIPSIIDFLAWWEAIHMIWVGDIGSW